MPSITTAVPYSFRVERRFEDRNELFILRGRGYQSDSLQTLNNENGNAAVQHLASFQGMRIDYFLTSPTLAPRVAEVKVFGSGADREGFLGSDHSPLLLTLRTRGPGEKGKRDASSDDR